jgi:glycosyltransferase 2 family protein
VRRWVRLELLSRAPEKVRATLGAIAEATLAYRHHWAAVATTVVVTLGLFFVRILFAKSLGLACGVNVDLLDLLLVIPLLWIVVMLPITIGSIGVQDAGYVVLMGLVGVDPAVAVSMSLIEHVVSRAVSLPGVLFVGDFIRKVPRQEQA